MTPRPSRAAGRLARRALSAVLIGLAACGGDGGTGPRTAGFSVVAGGGTSDTVGATQLQALVVVVRGPDGKPVADGTVVNFAVSPPADSTRRGERGIMLCPLAATTCAIGNYQYYYSSALSDTADARGQAKAQVGFGTVAGTAQVVVTVPEFGLKDSVAYTVKPGAVARVRFSTHDTTVVVGGRFQLRANAVDRFGNARTEPVTFSGGSNVADIDATGMVTAKDVGRVALFARYSTLMDTSYVSVPPTGRIAAYSTGSFLGITTVNLDGSYRRTTVATRGQDAAFPRLSPDRNTVVYFDREFGGAPSLYAVDSTGANRRVLVTGPVLSPNFSRDGAWVYYTVPGTGGAGPSLWRIRVDGSGATRLFTSPTAGGSFEVSPDGAQAAFLNGGLAIVTLATGASRQLSVSSSVASVRWSPDGSFLAYYSGAGYGTIYGINADGTNNRVLTPAGHGYSYFDLSPDGRFMVARDDGVGTLVVIQLSDKAFFALPLGYDMYEPSWRWDGSATAACSCLTRRRTTPLGGSSPPPAGTTRRRATRPTSTHTHRVRAHQMQRSIVRPRRAARAAIPFALLAAAACGSSGDSTGPKTAGFSVVAGGGTSDTVGAKQLQALVVAVRGANGKPAGAGVVVNFVVAAPTDSLRRGERGIALCPLSAVNCATGAFTFGYYYDYGGYQISDTTDAKGEAKVQIAFGTVAGPAYVVMTAPEFGTKDSVRYTVKPGAVAHVRIATRDTTISVGGHFVERASTVDRFGNARTEAASFTPISTGAVSVDAAGSVTALGFGRTAVVARYAALADTVYVSVPPTGRIVAYSSGFGGTSGWSISAVNLDGSNPRLITSSLGLDPAFPDMSPDRKLVTFLDRESGAARPSVYVVDSSGANRRAVATGSVNGPRFAADGSKVYYTQTGPSPDGASLWSVKVDGTGATKLWTAPNSSGGGYFDVSADGTKAVWAANTVTLVDLTTGTSKVVPGISSISARFTPQGSIVFANNNEGSIYTMAGDGTNLRRVPTTSYLETVVSLSPDGKWALSGTSFSSGSMVVVELASGATIPLALHASLYEPSWR